jgi:8-oxo-dGTP pyrophosphatase MutT (NUDIX family)
MEEFGMEAELKHYLGSIASHFPLVNSDIIVEKTTLYFFCDFISQDDALRSQEDIERESEIKWFDPEELIVRMKEQGKRLGREDMDESSVIENLMKR